MGDLGNARRLACFNGGAMATQRRRFGSRPSKTPHAGVFLYLAPPPPPPLPPSPFRCPTSWAQAQGGFGGLARPETPEKAEPATEVFDASHCGSIY